MRKLLAGLCLLPALAGCAPGAASVAVVRPREPVLVACRGSNHRYDARLILGLTEREASTIVERWGCLFRLTKVDGRVSPLTAGRVGWRVDVELEDGRIVRIASIG